MGRALSIEVTAEGVETPGQLRLLRQNGVTTMQGYDLGRPMTLDAPTDLLLTTGANGRKFAVASG